MVVLLYVLCALLLLIAAAGLALCRYALFGRRQTVPESVRWAREHVPALKDFDFGALERIGLTGADAKPLPGYLVRCGKAPRGCVVITHGYTDTHIGGLKYAPVYLDLGFDCLVYDLRGHGDNPRTACTYSVRESADLDAVIRTVRGTYPVVGLHGESLGAATTAAVMRFGPDAAFAVCDCGFSEIMPIMENGLRAMHLPVFLSRIASFFSRIVCGSSFKDMRPIDALEGKGVRVPFLFIHGEADDFISPDHSRRMHAALPASRLVLIPGAGHAASVLTDPEGYARAVRAFVEEVSAAAPAAEGGAGAGK